MTLLGVLCAAVALQSATPLPPAKIAAVETEITALMARWRIPGLSIAIVMDDHVRFASGYGMADVENAIPARSTTVYRLASVTKPLTAVAAMQLSESGKLDLDAPIQKFAPAFPEKAWPITARQLLAHLAGVRNYKPTDFAGQHENARYYGRLDDALGLFKDDPLESEPGTRWAYTTFGYTLLGVAIQGASGQTYADYMRDHVFLPAHMTHTRPDSVYDIIPNRARGYTRLGIDESFRGRPPEGEVRNADFGDMSYKLPAGGLVSTVEDLARFAIAFRSDALVGHETFLRMTAPQRTADGTATPYGLGWYIEGVPGRQGVVSHGGVQKGVTSMLFLLPKERFAVAILTNLEGGGLFGLDRVAARIADILLPPTEKQ